MPDPDVARQILDAAPTDPQNTAVRGVHAVPEPPCAPTAVPAD